MSELTVAPDTAVPEDGQNVDALNVLQTAVVEAQRRIADQSARGEAESPALREYPPSDSWVPLGRLALQHPSGGQVTVEKYRSTKDSSPVIEIWHSGDLRHVRMTPGGPAHFARLSRGLGKGSLLRPLTPDEHIELARIISESE